ncbi:phosphoenolpyruvate carboxykinase (ATP) [Flagellimonas sediminis]|uniref:phosphoenolpyruvate carboxykinase (ATP) n=1 Tax=Flagellimonas sediminis TaxID=2696468 RepID=UPI0028BE6AD6|nr:phosphoenolpyruvate carboxykinase (ATP) [Allomuricauda sediminis]
MDGDTFQKLTVDKGMGTETENGTLCIDPGKFTGRSPKDRFLVLMAVPETTLTPSCTDIAVRASICDLAPLNHFSNRTK